MNDSASMNRRVFLRLAGLLVLSLSLGRHRMPTGMAGPAESASAAAWRTVIPMSRSARILGERYLSAVPEERNSYLLMQRLSTAVGTDLETSAEAPLALSSDRRRERVRERVCQDFQDDEIVQLDGWVLARTECRICALSVLLG